MFQLTYISTARLGLGQEDIDAILRASRAKNALSGVTGLLVHDGVRFLQALEGDVASVRITFERIKRDDRHRATVILSEREVADRQFGLWSMASQQGASLPGAVTMPQIVDALVSKVADPNTRALFSSFARVRRQVA